MAIDIFSIKTLQESINNAKRYNTKDYYLPKGNTNIIPLSSKERTSDAV